LHLSPAWVAALSPIVLAFLGLGAWALRWAIRLLVATHDFLADWPKMKTAVTGLQEEIAAIKAETRPNGGNSMRDVVHRTADDVAVIKDEQARLRVQVETRYPPPSEGK
jgi:hypothetical protein